MWAPAEGVLIMTIQTDHSGLDSLFTMYMRGRQLPLNVRLRGATWLLVQSGYELNYRSETPVRKWKLENKDSVW